MEADGRRRDHATPSRELGRHIGTTASPAAGCQDRAVWGGPTPIKRALSKAAPGATAGPASRSCVFAVSLAFAPLPGWTQDARDLLFDTLRTKAAALARDPGDHDAAREVARILSELGGYHGAAAIEASPSLATRAGQAAEWVRWGADIEAETPARRHALTDRAIAMLDDLIPEARASGDRDMIARLESDRVIALRNRERWKDVLAVLTRMRAEGQPIRPYVREAEADALLALRRPEEARAIYGELATADPGNRNVRVGRFFAEIECEDFAAAFATADELDDPVIAAQARNYAGLDAEAWRRVAPVAGRAPAAAFVRSATGSIEASRGWLRKAHEDIRIASSLAPDDTGISVSLAESHLRRRDLQTVRAMSARLSADFPGDASVLRLDRELRDFDSATYELTARARQESGGAVAAPGPGVEVTGRVYSAPIHDAWRLFAGFGYATARPPEGDALRTRVGAGAEWRGADASMEASAWSNGGDVLRSGAAASGSWSPNDVWSLAADYERYSWETPLRAVLHGITSDGGGIGVGAAWNESRAAWVGLRAHRFSDGNERRQYRFAWAERVAETPSWSLTLRPELYGSRNTSRDAPYFNPSSDLALSLTLDWQGLIWRRYEESLRHRITVRAGGYRQEGYADGWVGGIAYGQAWQPGSRLELRWGVEIGRARYDGANENTAIVFISATGRF